MAKTISAILNLKDNFSNTLKKTTSNTKQFQRQMQMASNTAKEMQSAILGSIGKIGAGIGLVDVAKQSVMLASSLVEVQNVVDTTFKDQAGTINTWSQSALKSFGLSQLEAEKYTGTLGAMIKTSGISGEQLTKMSTDLTGLSGDFASFFNLDPEEAFDKIRAGMSGQSKPLMELGINMSVANLQAYALTQGITTSYKAMSQAQQVQLRYNYLMSVSTDKQGDFAKTSRTFANELRTTLGTLKQIGANIASLFLPVLTDMLGRFLDLLDYAPKVGKALTGAFDQLKNGADISDVFALLQEDITEVFYSYLPESIAKFFDKGLYMVRSFTVEVINNLMRIGSDLVEPFESTINAIWGFIQTVANGIGNMFRSIGDHIDLTGPFNIIRDLIGGFLSDVRDVFNFFNDNWGTLSPIIMGVAGAILFFNGALKTIETTMSIVKAVQEAWAVANGACNIAMMVLNGTLMISPLGWIALAIGAVIAVGVALYENWGVISAKASELWTSLTTVFTSIGDSIQGVFSGIGSAIGGFIDGAIDKLNQLINGFNNLTTITLPGWLGGGTMSASVPNIPKFATGTQYFAGGLANINEQSGEIVNLPNGSQVIPADKTDKILNKSGGTIVNVTIQGNVIGNHDFVNEMGQIITNKIKLAIPNN